MWSSSQGHMGGFLKQWSWRITFFKGTINRKSTPANVPIAIPFLRCSQSVCFGTFLNTHVSCAIRAKYIEYSIWGSEKLYYGIISSESKSRFFSMFYHHSAPSRRYSSSITSSQLQIVDSVPTARRGDTQMIAMAKPIIFMAGTKGEMRWIAILCWSLIKKLYGIVSTALYRLFSHLPYTVLPCLLSQSRGYE